MTKLKLLYIIIGVLLCTNVFFLFRSQRPPHDGPKREIIERLHFDDHQVAAYELLISNHRQTIDSLEQSIRNQKQQLYQGIGKNISGMEKDALLSGIAANIQKIELTNVQHFEAIRDLCRPDQKKYFEDLSSSLTEMFRPGKKKP